MKHPFRALPKEFPGGRIPTALADKLRHQAARERRTISSVLTEAVSRGLGIDPGRFGIGIKRQPIEADEPMIPASSA